MNTKLNKSIFRYISKNPSHTTKTLQNYLKSKHLFNISESTLSKFKKKNKIVRKRVNNVAQQRSTPRIIRMRNSFKIFMLENFQPQQIL